MLTEDLSQHPADDPRQWSGPIEKLDDAERRSLLNSMTAAPRPRVAIDEALERGWFEIWYQPKIDLKRRCLAGAEALARIRHPDLGVLLPGNFLPEVSEDSVSRLTEHALVETLHNWAKFEEAGFNLHLSINVPVSALLTLEVPALVEAHRPPSGRWPGIIVEIIEDQVVRDRRLTQQVASRLQASGIKIALDDFGAGFSSLSSLRELPFAELKLDQGLVRDCAVDAMNAAICQTAIDLAHRFGSAAVAEGIESQADLQAIIGMGCDFGQGVLIAPPMPRETFLDLLMQRVNKSPREAVAPAAVVGRVA